jgi:cytochrome c-type biogenesis protein CcmF
MPLPDLGDLGRISLGFAFGAAVFSLLIVAIGLKLRVRAMVLSASNGLTAVAILTTLAMLILVSAFITHDFSLAFVAENSSRAMPAPLTIAAVWGGQAGSLLTWTWMLSLLAAISSIRVKIRAPELFPQFSAVLAFLLVFFLSVLTFASSPFHELAVVPPDGNGLNPLLWDTAMQIHPPMLTAGYVSFAVPFALAVAALLVGKVDRTWLHVTRGWMLLAWAFQGGGLILGAWWAYRVLGWGGYWGWDPVENVALIPWLLATAYLHSAMVQERRGMLKTWNVSLALSPYVLAIFGTFVVRSGVLTSVHSFATSSLGPLFFVFLGALTICSIALVLYRRAGLRSERYLESTTSREAGFLINNVLLVSIAASTFWGTIFPLISEIFRGAKVAVGAPFYNQVNGPLLLSLLVLAGIGPLLSWHRTSLRRAANRFTAPILLALILSGLLVFLGVRQGLAVIAFGAVAFVVCAIGLEFGRASYTYARHVEVRLVSALPVVLLNNRRRYGGYVVHLGMALIALAIIGTGFFKTEEPVSLVQDQPLTVGGYTLIFRDLQFSASPDLNRVDAVIDVLRPDGGSSRVVPGRQVHRGWESQPISRVGIDTLWPALDDLYLLLTAWDESGEAITLRTVINPLVGYLWLGGVVYFFGVLIVAWPGTRVRTVVETTVLEGIVPDRRPS